MVKLSSTCRAQEPATCKYHGYEVRASAYIEQGLYDDALRELATRDRLGVNHEDFPNDIQHMLNKSIPADKIRTHTSHCCNIHGCKYGNNNCPVQNGTSAQEYPCQQCDWEVEEYTERYGKMKNHYKNIKAVDPDGCGCTECLTGQYIPEATWRLYAKAGDMRDILNQTVRNNTSKPLRDLLKTGYYTRDSATHFQQQLNRTAPTRYPADTWGL